MAQQIFFIDLETTGLDPTKHGIVELAVLEWEHEKGVVWDYRTDMDPRPCEFTDRAMAINGFSLGRVQDAPKPLAALQPFLERIRGRPLLAGWNVHFDAEFLAACFEKHGINWLFDYHFLDVQSVFRALKMAGVIGGRLHLAEQAAKCGVADEGERAHTALVDTKWTWLLFEWAQTLVREAYAGSRA